MARARPSSPRLANSSEAELQRLEPGRAEHLVLELAGVDEVHRALEGGHRAVAVPRLEPRGDADHLPADHALEAELALAAVRLAREEVADGACEGLFAHLGARDGRALGVVRRTPVASAAGTASGHRERRHQEEKETRGPTHGVSQSIPPWRPRATERSRTATYLERPRRTAPLRRKPAGRVRDFRLAIADGCGAGNAARPALAAPDVVRPPSPGSR